MRKLSNILLFALICGSTSLLFADEGCKKCEIMREYHKNHPSKYKFYDDYLKDLEENGATEDDINPEDLPPEVQYIMNQSSDVNVKKKFEQK